MLVSGDCVFKEMMQAVHCQYSDLESMLFTCPDTWVCLVWPSVDLGF